MRIGKRFIKNVFGVIFNCLLIALIIWAIFGIIDHSEIRFQEGNDVVEYGEKFYDRTKGTLFNLSFSWFLKKGNEVNTQQLGEQTVTYYFFGKEASRIVTVVDTARPSISLVGKFVYKIEDDISNFEDPGCIAEDNVDGDITDKIERSVENVGANRYKIIYSVADSSGNTNYTYREVFAKPKPQPTPTEPNGTVYLTFDDGPSAITDDVLDVLQANDVCATFFVVGFSTETESWKVDLMQRAINEGHTIALHGNSHEYSNIYSSVENAVNNFVAENQLINDVLGIDVKIIRFPGGVSNTVSKKYCDGVMTDASKALLDAGYSYFDWNVDSDDAGQAVNSSERICENVINGVKPGRNNVVLMHDSGHHSATLEALPEIIEKLKDEGYEFKAISDDTPAVRHGINN